jgi:hypothetical protein
MGTALLVLLALFKQLALARRGKLLPGGGHLLKMLSMAWRRGPCHLTAPGRMLMIFVDFSQRRNLSHTRRQCCSWHLVPYGLLNTLPVWFGRHESSTVDIESLRGIR